MRTPLRCIPGICAGALVVLAAGAALGQQTAPLGASAPASLIDSGDLAWILTCSAIVLMMTLPGLALFYGGLVRSRNVLSIVMQCFLAAALVSVTWVLWGYSLAFGPDHAGLVGDLSLFGLRGVSHEVGTVVESIPDQAFMVFQLMFAIITPALVTGAFAERMKFSAFFLFLVLWTTFIYSPLAHWVWGGGWLGARGALDFAGGTVVHISSGTSALVAAVMIGRRRGYGREPMPPHNVPFTVMGASLLWVGWFGFNAGSALGANGAATIAFVNTNTATGAAVLGWMFSEWIGKGKPTALGAATGAVAGLVAITPAAGFVEPWASILIGLGAGWLCYKACNWKHRIGYDDALDVVGVHGVGGTWGAIATGIFAASAIGGTDGLVYGNGRQVIEQLIAVGATYAFCGLGTFLILGLVNKVVGLRVDEEAEEEGLDLALHSESAYATAGTSSPLGEVTPRRGTLAASPSSLGSPPSSAEEPPARNSGNVAGHAPAPAGALAEGNQPFRVIVDGIEPRSLASWWRDLCSQDPAKAPRAFRDIYPNLRSFEGNAFLFRGGDPAGTRDRLSYLLDIYGAHGTELRVETI